MTSGIRLRIKKPFIRLWLLFLLTGAALVSLPALSFGVTIGQECGGGVVFYVDASGRHGLIAARSDMKGHSSGCAEGFLPGTTRNRHAGSLKAAIIATGFCRTGSS